MQKGLVQDLMLEQSQLDCQHSAAATGCKHKFQAHMVEIRCDEMPLLTWCCCHGGCHWLLRMFGVVALSGGFLLPLLITADTWPTCTALAGPDMSRTASQHF
jgi:hypothetical protein